MTPLKFLQKYAPAANVIARNWNIPPIVTLAQAALESGWGEKAPGYNFFGYTATNGYKGQKQLLKTVEYHTNPNVWYPVRISVTKIADNKYKYLVRRYFKCYSNAVDSFTDYAMLISNKYNDAFDYVDDPERFFTVIFNNGYATSPAYHDLVLSVMKTMKKYLK